MTMASNTKVVLMAIRVIALFMVITALWFAYQGFTINKQIKANDSMLIHHLGGPLDEGVSLPPREYSQSPEQVQQWFAELRAKQFLERQKVQAENSELTIQVLRLSRWIYWTIAGWLGLMLAYAIIKVRDHKTCKGDAQAKT
jgi:hypothetical protein